MKTILVVDDFASVRFYHESLLKQGGFATIPAVDGTEAFAVLERSPVDLIMLDLLMPKMSGREFINRVWAHPRFAAIPILLITSEDKHVDVDSFRGRSSCSVLKKPILPQALIESVRRLLGSDASD